MSNDPCHFEACSPRNWMGRYARIPGNESVLHLVNVGSGLWPVVYWTTDEGTGTCAAEKTPAAQDLARSVATAKCHAGGSGGGSFVINECGQVLVPAGDGDGRRFLAGRLTGRLLFANPFDDGSIIDLYDSTGLRCGDPWDRPYVGVPYNLHRSSKVYFYRQDASGGGSVYPPCQDGHLIRALRTIRRSGAVRFIVNPGGLVLTKRAPAGQWKPQEAWEAVFVGHINTNSWFDME